MDLRSSPLPTQAPPPQALSALLPPPLLPPPSLRTRPEAREAARRVQASDLELFLRLRAAEMPPGAALYLSFGATPSSDDDKKAVRHM